jgi:hypothetical protein
VTEKTLCGGYLFSTAALGLGYRRFLFIPDLGRAFTFSGIAAKRDYINANPNVARAFMTALTEGKNADLKKFTDDRFVRPRRGSHES